MATTAGLALAAAGVTACGSSSGSTSTSSSASANQQSNGQPGGGRRGIFSDPKVQECLKKQGVTVPSFRRGNGPPPGGQPPSGSNGSGGTRRRRNFDSSQFQKLRQALQKCGVPGAPPSRSTTNDDTTAS